MLFDRKNIQEDESPWVNIMISLPNCPSFEFDMIPITSNLICPIDE